MVTPPFGKLDSFYLIGSSSIGSSQMVLSRKGRFILVNRFVRTSQVINRSNHDVYDFLRFSVVFYLIQFRKILLLIFQTVGHLNMLYL